MSQIKYGTGSVKQLDDGRYRWTGYYKDGNGKICRPIKTFNTLAEVEAFQGEQEERIIVKKEQKSRPLTVNEVFKMWEQDYHSGRLDIADSTFRNSSKNIEVHILPIVGESIMKKIDTTVLEHYFNNLRTKELKDKTIYNIYCDLKMLVNYAITKEIIYENPIKDLNIKNPKKGKRVGNIMSFEEYQKIIENEDNFKSYYINAIMFLAETGLRASELAFREEDIEKTEDGYWIVYIDKSIHRVKQEDGKTILKVVNDLKTEESERYVPLNLFAQSALQRQLDYRKEHNIKYSCVFCTSNGKCLEARNLLRALHAYCDKCGIPHRGLHSLRKLYINHSLKNGITPADLSKVTGHSIQTMMKYYHSLDKTALKRIADATEARTEYVK